MIDITLEYYPGKLGRFFHLFNPAVFSGNQPAVFVRKVPQKWNELSKRQLLALATASYLIKDRNVQKIYVAERFLNLPFGIFKRISVSDLKFLYVHMSRLFGENNLSRTVITSFRHKGVRYCGPSNAGNNMSLIEFSKADKFYADFLRSKDSAVLDKLIACLYREKRTDVKPWHVNYHGDMRVPFNEYHVDNRAMRFASLAPAYKYAILIQYSGFRNWLQKRYPLTFSEGKPSKYGFPELVVELAGPRFGTIDETFKHDMHPVFIYTEKALEKADKR